MDAKMGERYAVDHGGFFRRSLHTAARSMSNTNSNVEADNVARSLHATTLHEHYENHEDEEEDMGSESSATVDELTDAETMTTSTLAGSDERSGTPEMSKHDDAVFSAKKRKLSATRSKVPTPRGILDHPGLGEEEEERNVHEGEEKEEMIDDDSWMIRPSPSVRSSPQNQEKNISEDEAKASNPNSHNENEKSNNRIDNITDNSSPSTPSAVPTASATSNIPAAFQATIAFASPRDFFVPTETEGDTNHVVCTLCQVTIGSRVYSLKRHLFRHHPQVFRVDAAHRKSSVEQSKRLEGVSGMASVIKLKEEATSTAKHTKRKGSTSGDGYDETRIEKMNEAFVEWLRSDIIPMKAVESKFFREFLSIVNPTFKLPQVIVQPRVLAKDSGGIMEKKRYMQGLCIQGNGGPAELLTDLVIPTPKPDEALIKVLRAGICGTDLHMINNYKPGYKGVLGHEFVGIVEQLGASFSNDEAAYQTWMGNRVVGEINIVCDGEDCKTCRDAMATDVKAESPSSVSSSLLLGRRQVKRRNHCPNRACLGIVAKNGAFAEYITLPVANLHVVPDSVVDSHAVFAEPLAAACRIVEQRIIRPTDNVAILGDGKLGLLVAEVLHALHVANSVTLVGKHHEKLALMKNVVTATYEYEPSLAQSLHEAFDVCVESTGSPSGIQTALQLLKVNGTMIMKSTCSTQRSPVDMGMVQAKRIRVVGSRCGPIPMALELLRDKKVDMQKYIHGVYPLARAETALVHAAQRGVLKIQLILV